jgi:hypothetical protein
MLGFLARRAAFVRRRVAGGDGHAGGGRWDSQHIGEQRRSQPRAVLYEAVQSLELSVRLPTPPYQPVDTIAGCNERKSRADDRSWSAMDATTFPIGGGGLRSVIEHVASSCGT